MMEVVLITGIGLSALLATRAAIQVGLAWRRRAALPVRAGRRRGGL